MTQSNERGLTPACAALSALARDRGEERGRAVRDALLVERLRGPEGLEGDDSRIIMDRVIPFIRRAVEEAEPFLAVVWFHAPHTPVVTSRHYMDMYAGRSAFERRYLGCLTAMDEQVGRLRHELEELGVARARVLRRITNASAMYAAA